MSKLGYDNGSLEEPDNYTQDGTVDLKGHPVLRSKTGRWRACSFIVAYEVFERMAYYGIVSNLVLYLSRKLHQGTVKSSNNVTNWVGTVWMMPLLGAYIADAHLGRYWTFLISSAIYLMGMCLLTLSVSLPSLKPPSCGEAGITQNCDKRASNFQVGFFYAALYVIAVGTGGTKPNISTMGADQFDDFEPKERTLKLSFFNWWMCSILFGILFSTTILVYIQDNVGFSLGYGIPTIGLAVSVCMFLVGTPFYRHRNPSGSPLTRIAKVLVAAVKKRNIIVPKDPKQLHELRLEEYSTPGKYKYMISHTGSLSFLDKAAVETDSSSPWDLSPVTHVEETKQMMKMIPILAATIVPSAMIAQVTTLFVKQCTTLDRTIGSKFNIPPAGFGVFVTIFMLISIVIYDRIFVPFIRRYTKNPRGITMLQRMGIGILLHVVIMVVACLVERKRLTAARTHGVTAASDVVPLSIFILLPQFALVGVADNFLEVAKLEFFYDQAPQGMKSLGTAYVSTSSGIGHFLSSLVLSLVAEVTSMDGRKGWILNNLNLSHLDYFYAFYAVLSFLNLMFFLVVSNRFVYNTDLNQGDERESPATVISSPSFPK